MKPQIELIIVKKSHEMLKNDIANHYTNPLGFVGRSICYKVVCNNVFYGHIVGGSATRFLPGRDDFINMSSLGVLNNIVNNIFFHVEPKDGYPLRNFTTQTIRVFEERVASDWQYKYNDRLIAYETLVELPRTGECCRRAGWSYIGTTKGFTCKRVGGKVSTEKFSGTRIWDYKNLRPKLVFMKLL